MTQLPIAITPGEPAGIGPDILLALAMEPLPRKIIAIADLAMLQARAKLLNLDIHCVQYDVAESENQHHQPGVLPVYPVALGYEVLPGDPNVKAASYLLKTLDIAIDGCLSGQFHALVTGPIQKSVIADAGIPFSGHTEYLAERSGKIPVVMMLASPQMRVALHTTHVPLAKVSEVITKDCLNQTLEVLYAALNNQFGISNPRIGVCGVNPHAGEGGHIGREELEVISPVVHQWREKGYQISGPLSADTAFTAKHLVQYDVMLAMFHDQGLPVIKAQDFGDTVNITLGLPFIRTSVDHGTALALAGSGEAKADSLRAAILQAHGFHVPTIQ